MKLKNTDMVEQAMTRIELIQQHMQNLDEAARYVSERKSYADRAREDAGALRDALIRLELHEWRNVAMWGLTLDDAERDRIKAAVHQRFLRDGMSVTHWMNGGVTPSQWFSADEEEFREMARKAFSPKG